MPSHSVRIRALIAFVRAAPSCPDHLPEPSSLNTVTSGGRLHNMGLKVGTTFSVMASEEVKGGFQGVTGEGAREASGG